MAYMSTKLDIFLAVHYLHSIRIPTGGGLWSIHHIKKGLKSLEKGWGIKTPI
jgi:hypothetical protein